MVEREPPDSMAQICQRDTRQEVRRGI